MADPVPIITAMASTPGRRIDSALLALQLASQGSATDYSKDVVSSTPTKTQEPPAVDVTALDAAELAERLAFALERMVDGEPWRPVMSLSSLKTAVRPFAGRSSGFVAYALGQPTERVAAARAADGLDAETGLAKPRPLTSRDLPV